MEGTPGQFERSTPDKPVLGYAQPPQPGTKLPRLPVRPILLFWGCIITPVLAALAGMQGLAAYFHASALTLRGDERIVALLKPASQALAQPSAMLAVLAVTMAAAMVIVSLSGLRWMWLRRGDPNARSRAMHTAVAMLIAAVGYAAVIIPYILNLYAVYRDHASPGRRPAMTTDLLALVSLIAVLGALAAVAAQFSKPRPQTRIADSTAD
mgnify:CR=1 FL=1